MRTTSSSLLRALCVLALSLSLTACGGASAFGDTFPDNHGEHIATVLSRLDAGRAQASAARRESSIAITVTAAPSRLQAYDLGAGKSAWTRTLRDLDYHGPYPP